MSEADANANANPDPDPNTGRYVLFLDDESGIVETFMVAGEVAGFDILGFSKPDKALDRFRQEPRSFRAVITDYTMQEMSCADFIARIQEIRGDVPILLCTGNAEHEIQEVAGTLGVRSVLYKPFDYETLEAFLNAIPGARG